MTATNYLESLVHRTVTFRYSAHDLSFDLSTALFSSAAVDAGTRLLLRTIVGPVRGREISRVTDVGCGTGTLGLSVSAATGARLLATDRDALACWFTSRNAARNQLDCESEPALDTLTGWAGRANGLAWEPDSAENEKPRSDVTVCNIPAKAGEPVIERLCSRVLAATAGGGLAAFVVVTPLAPLLLRWIASEKLQVVSRNESSQHLAVVCELGEHPGDSEPGAKRLPDAYLRARYVFEYGNGNYEMDTAYNLAEFDTLSYQTELALGMFNRHGVRGNGVVWGAGQGHLPLAAAQGGGDVAVSDRDVLALEITRRNLERHGFESAARYVAAPCVTAVADMCDAASQDWMVVSSSPEPGSLWSEEIIAAASRVLRPAGTLVVTSSSTALSRLSQSARGTLSSVDSRKYRGYRVDLYRRSD